MLPLPMPYGLPESALQAGYPIIRPTIVARRKPTKRQSLCRHLHGEGKGHRRGANAFAALPSQPLLPVTARVAVVGHGAFHALPSANQQRLSRIPAKI